MGISGIYPQIIDSEWVQETSPRSQRVARSETAPTPRRSGIVAEIPLPPQRPAESTEQAIAAVPAPASASPPALSETWSSVAATEQPQAADPDSALASADVSKAYAIADPSAKPAVVRPAQRYVARVPVVKRRVVRTEHHRSTSGAYAQYGGGGGWSGWPGPGSPYRF
jgi:hypothetical protein